MCACWIALAGAPEGLRGGLGVVMSTFGVVVASGVEGAGRPLSSMSMSSPLSDEDEGGALVSNGGASSRGGRTVLALHSRKRASWSSPQLGQWEGEVG